MERSINNNHILVDRKRDFPHPNIFIYVVDSKIVANNLFDVRLT